MLLLFFLRCQMTLGLQYTFFDTVGQRWNKLCYLYDYMGLIICFHYRFIIGIMEKIKISIWVANGLKMNLYKAFELFMFFNNAVMMFLYVTDDFSREIVSMMY